ncbi:nuclear transport factor 2 family protein [Pseudoalteromonas obscura]|uniref:Nuclear transport factor 2 family protein n=1 Tax=Pseudoalteromonas obscura TaxID=3048491 RepID=A0ABT7EP19_9GAMM|nr:nuclear transport factor 2 family protein [Pseudoalteromonas sp. P94(2023)]MDK2596811.1 nuclear transport factor 2 family protein [Pseudoalteromonas sp. P94(2023)]
MIKLLSVAVAALTFVASTASYAEPITGKEYQAVVETAYNYFNGAANGDQKLLAKAFDQEFGHVKMITKSKESGKESIKSVPLDEFSGYFKKATKDKWEANILSVDIVDDQMAMVKLDFHTPKTHYIDYLVMYKRQNEWRIINKTFVAKKKSQ